MGSRLTAIQPKQAGGAICSATEGDASWDRATVKLTQGIKWAVPKPLDYLQTSRRSLRSARNARADHCLRRPARSLADPSDPPAAPTPWADRTFTLQKQVALTATIHDSGVPTKSFAKTMYIPGMLGDGSNVRLTDKKEG